MIRRHKPINTEFKAEIIDENASFDLKMLSMHAKSS